MVYLFCAPFCLSSKKFFILPFPPFSPLEVHIFLSSGVQKQNCTANFSQRRDIQFYLVSICSLPIGPWILFSASQPSCTQKIGRQLKPPANAVKFTAGQTTSAQLSALTIGRRSILKGLRHRLENLVVIKRLIHKSLRADLACLIDGVIIGQGRDHQHPGGGMVL